jgi:peptide/nickel transport system substrate-binding protein
MSSKLKGRWVVRAAVALVGAVTVLSGCASGSTQTDAASARHTSTHLRVAFVADMGPPDPDTFYATEGLMVTNSVYEGLLQYANNSTAIEGSLADLPAVSRDGLTYTFKLHAGVKFHDGTPFTSAAVAFSFARRKAINQGPAYMLAHVKSVGTPSPLTAVVHLDQPVSAFLDYLASPFGPKMMSPTAIRAHSVGNDHAQAWLHTHDAGTGPYEITSWLPEQKYVLSAFPGYWGKQQAFKEVDISILPDISVQQLELERGQLDMIMHGLLPRNVDSISHEPGFAVHEFPTELKTMLFVNPHRGPFTTVAARDALRQALDKAVLTRAFGSAGTVSTQIYPAGELPASATTSTVPYDPGVLRRLVPTLPTKQVDIGYDSTDPRNQQVADLLLAELQGLGLQATDRAIPISQIFGLASQPSQAPTILIQTTNPDAAHPDTWARIYMGEGGGANYLQCDDPQVDKLLNAGLSATIAAAVDDAYGKAGDRIAQDGCFIDVADVKDVIVTRTGLTGFYHVPSIPWALKLAALANS